MKITKEALELTKKFAAGASCKIDFDNIEKTMFWPHYEALAQKKEVIDVEAVKEYWFEIHNQIVFDLFRNKKLTAEQAKNCMVRPEEEGKYIFAFHGGKSVMILTKQGAENLKRKVEKIMDLIDKDSQ